MNTFAAIGVAFGSAGAAAVATLKTIGYLKNSSTLSELVLEWLTLPGGTQSTFQVQYLQIHRRLFGDSVWSRQRSLFIAAMFIFIWVVEVPLALIYRDKPPMTGWIGKVSLFAHMHMDFIITFPLWSALLISISFALTHISFWIFDKVTLRTIAFGNRLYIYIVLILASYLAIFFLVAWFMGFFLIVVLSRVFEENDMTFMESVVAVLRAPFYLPTIPGFRSNVAFSGIIILCTSAMCVASIFNLVYAAGLSVMRIDQFFREKYRWKQDELLKNPVEYLSYVSAALIFLVSLPVAFAIAAF